MQTEVCPTDFWDIDNYQPLKSESKNKTKVS